MTASTHKPKTARKTTPKPPAAKRGAEIVAALPPPPTERNGEGDVIEFLKAIDTFKRKGLGVFEGDPDGYA